MRLKGKKIEGPASKILVFPRGDESESVKLEVVAVLNMDEFQKKCPEPIPPWMVKRGGAKVPDFDNGNYKKQKARHNQLYTLWLYFNSLYCPAEYEGDERTPVEWDKIDRDDPNTWVLFEVELVEAGFSEFERMRIVNTILEVNSLSEDKMEEARNSFLASRQAPQLQSSSQNTEADDMLSGEPASDSE